MVQTAIRDLLENRSLIIVSNRGPVSFNKIGDRFVESRGSGGLVTAMSAVCREVGARWISAAMTPAERELAALAGTSIPVPSENPDYQVRLVDIPEEVYERYYNSISNPLIWFVFHYLWNLADYPRITDETFENWRTGYLEANRLFAEAAIEMASQSVRPVILLQDYHLFTAAKQIKEALPDVMLMHFNHIPWPEPEYFGVLPDEMRKDIMEGLLSADLLGFQVPKFARAFRECCREFGDYETDGDDGVIVSNQHTTLTKAYPISIDAEELVGNGSRPEVLAHEERLLEENAGMKLLVRSDRADLSKNILRGFEAFDLMLTEHPDLIGQVKFLALLYPTREKLTEYSDYRKRIEATVDQINKRHATPGWQPIRLRIKDDYFESIAAMKLYDVLLVNPIFDGMNLVAKEGPLINEKDGLLVLSKNAGSYCEMSEAALTINPFDVAETARMLYLALTAKPEERSLRADWLKEIVRRNDSHKWVYHQMKDLVNLEEAKKSSTPLYATS